MPARSWNCRQIDAAPLMISRAEFGAALAGVRGLLRLDAKALALFNATHDGFWRSFWAAAIMAPFALIALVREADAVPPDSLWRFVAFQVIAYAVGWLAYPLVMVRIADLLGRRDRYFQYMVAYNWFHVAWAVLGGPIMLLGVIGVIPPMGEGVLNLVVLVVLLGYEWFITRHALKVEAGTAAALVIIDLLLSVIIDRLSVALP